MSPKAASNATSEENNSKGSRGELPHEITDSVAALKPVISDSFPPNLRYAGIIVGLFLIVIGIFLILLGKSSALSSLITCVGFGIVLASFGSKASGSWAGWTATGAGAMAVFLFLILQHYTPVTSQSPVKRGQIRGDFGKVADIRIIDESPFYEFRDPTTASVRFIILDRALRSQRMSLQVDTIEKGAGKEFFELIANSHKVSELYLSNQEENDHVIQWTFDYEHRLVKDGKEIIFAEADQLDENMLPIHRSNHARISPSFALASAALAQSAPASAGQANDLVTKIASAVLLLDSDDPTARRNARDVLSAIGIASISPVMAALRANPADYRLKGGAIYILWSIINQNLDKKTNISDMLKDEDIPILVSAASDDDKTIRLLAAEFLYQLGDPRTIPFSVNAARNTHDNNRAYNQSIIVQQSIGNVPPTNKENVLNDVRRNLQNGPGANNDLVGRNGFLCRTLFGGGC